MMRPATVVAAALVAALAAAACAINPATSRPELVLSTVAQDRETGRKQAAEVEQSIGLAGDPALRAYVSQIGARLAQHAPASGFEFRFAIVDLVEANAFALPGGYVFVSRGLLPLANSEDEVAAVMAHEIGHVVARHSAARATVATPFAILTGVTAAATGLVSPLLGNAVGGLGALAGTLVLAPYSREQEREADKLGIEILAAAGWDPAALPRFLVTLEREEALAGNAPERPDFLSSHPSTPERVADTRALAAQTTRAASFSIATDHASFLSHLDGLLVGDDPAEGVFFSALFFQPELGFAVRFPRGWATANGREAVVAVAPGKRTLVGVTLAQESVGKGDDPVAAARAYGEKVTGTPFASVNSITINGLRAAHVLGLADSSSGRVAIDLTWIAFRGKVYRITALSPVDEFDGFRPDLESVPQSFRAATAEELRRVRAERLRIVRAHRGDTLAHLAAQRGSTWTSAEAAVANALEPDTVLNDGQLIKLAIPERWVPPGK